MKFLLHITSSSIGYFIFLASSLVKIWDEVPLTHNFLNGRLLMLLVSFLLTICDRIFLTISLIIHMLLHMFDSLSIYYVWDKVLLTHNCIIHSPGEYFHQISAIILASPPCVLPGFLDMLKFNTRFGVL